MMATIPNTVSHLVGPVVTVNNRAIQRCSICGEKLLDSIKNLTDQELKSFPVFADGTFIRYLIDDKKYQVLPYRKKMPEDLCIDLVEE